MILDYEIATFIAIVAIILVAGTIKITLGVGFGLVAMPLLLLVMDADAVVPFIAPLIFLQDLIILRQTWKHVPWRSAIFLAISAVIVAPFAVLLQTEIDPATLQIAISVIIISAGFTLLSGVKFPIKNETSALVVAGGISGALFPLVGISGPPVALFLVNQRWGMTPMRAVLAAFLVVLEAMTITTFALKGVVSRDSLVLDALMIPVLLVAVLFSTILLRSIDSNRYRKAVNGVIVTSAGLGLISLIVGSV